MLDANLQEKTKVRNIGGSETSLYSEIIHFLLHNSIHVQENFYS